jgi:hypothetical protein
MIKKQQSGFARTQNIVKLFVSYKVGSFVHMRRSDCRAPLSYRVISSQGHLGAKVAVIMRNIDTFQRKIVCVAGRHWAK